MIKQTLLNIKTKGISSSLPSLVAFLDYLYLKLPLPISAYVYSIARNTLFRDARRPYFEAIFENISLAKLEGDYLEFGVFRGTSFIMASKLAQTYNMPAMRLFAFDSFEGLPNSEGKAFTKSEFSCSEVLFRKIIEKAGMDLSKVVIVKGFYSNSLDEDTKRKYNIKAAIVHIDCDLYSSTKEVLNFIENIVTHGTILIFDDWDSFKDEDVENMGERKAFKEWSLFNCFEELYDFRGCGKAFIMKESPVLSQR
jgi:hypothetical protein